ncbi:hypothetical protein EYZ11_011429 [Aspergillus tanneri]|uniref:Phosphatidylinositol transfer protein SFH5 n=1 Tax=Aspergillus tanneri TaxID=1220188 RepID=A0A4S3J2S9_9EURO|nr:Non-classical phosphatidylinositol transfer protein (PITP) [Aspergillus tanneri]KAA8643078.1 Non-classical phosphatidylinositol transfer protein (PITP) [Aspergillus tanneri]THC89123.1 hypothetical protein EYZ11_011429 [Aspergillus tanneri]
MSDKQENPIEKVAESTTAAPAPVPEAHPDQNQEESAQKETTPLAATTEPPAVEAAAPETSEPGPASTEEQKDEKPAANKPAYLANNPSLGQFFDRLPSILSTTSHGEMWGVPLKDANDVPTVNVLIKFLRANEGNVKLAEEQLTKALQWRKQTNPTALADSGRFSASKFAGLGYLTTYTEADGKETVVTWNIYGAVKSIDDTFGNMDEFVQWRVALMELAVQELKMAQATSVIEYDGEDPYQMVQVHDYLNLSFLRLNPNLRAATKKTIDVFSTAYPELLREKFFVNVPAIMGWMFAAMKVFLSKNTTRKFHPISNGANLAREFSPAVKDKLPKAYGGSGPALLASARTVAVEENPPAPATPDAGKEAADETPKKAPAPNAKPAKAGEETTEKPTKADTAVTTQEAPAAAAEAK